MSVFSSINIQIPPKYSFWRRQKSQTERKTTFFDVCFEVYLTSRVYGLMPFSLIHKNGEISGVRVGALDLLWFIVALTIYATLIYFTPYNAGLLNRYPNKINKHIYNKFSIIIRLKKELIPIIINEKY